MAGDELDPIFVEAGVGPTQDGRVDVAIFVETIDGTEMIGRASLTPGKARTLADAIRGTANFVDRLKVA